MKVTGALLIGVLAGLNIATYFWAQEIEGMRDELEQYAWDRLFLSAPYVTEDGQ